MQDCGYGNWATLKKIIKNEEIFKYDYAFKCKTELELKNRIISLIKMLEKEKE